jgi:hypothetical protein
MLPASVPAGANLLRPYLDAVYRVRLPSGEHTVRVGTSLQPLQELAPEGTPWALITAFNPRSAQVPPMVNQAAQARLAARLLAARHRVFPAFNSAPSGTHQEPSLLALGVASAQADRLAYAFAQNAIVCGQVGAVARLRCYVDHWRAAGMDTAFVDWVASGTPDDRPQ